MSQNGSFIVPSCRIVLLKNPFGFSDSKPFRKVLQGRNG